MQHDFILLDRSGSMASQWGEAISSVNEYVKKLAEQKVDTGVTIAAFDGQGGLDFTVLRDRIIPSTMIPVSPTEVTPRGATPLYDAASKLADMALSGNYDKCAIIIMTDGEENTSREVDHAAVRAKLDLCRAKGWQVIFLGANFDNARQSSVLGGKAGQTIMSTAANHLNTMAATATMRASYAAGLTPDMTYTEDQKEEARK